MRPVQMMLKLWMLAPYPLLVCLIALLLLLTFTPVSATPLRQEGNSAELCEEGVAMFRNGQHAEALPLLEAGFAGREAEEFADPDDLGMCALVLGRLRDNTGDRIGALEAYEVALRQFQNSDIRELEGITVNNMGLVYYNQGHYDDALEHYEWARTIYQDSGNNEREGTTLNNIGLVYDAQGRYDDALDYYQQALAIHRDIGNRPEEATTLNNIGLAYYNQGRYEGALEKYWQALAIHREVGNRFDEGTTLNNIGQVYIVQGRYDDALDYYQQALVIHRDTGNRPEEATTLNNIGLVYRSQGRYDDALDQLQQALVILREVQGRADEGATLGNIGQVYYNQERYDDALNYYHQALTIHREINDQVSEGTTLNNIGSIYWRQERYDDALGHYQEALTIRRQVGDRLGEGTTLTNIGSVFHQQEHYDDALDRYQQALAILREVNNRVGEGATLNNIGRVYQDQERYHDALDYYRQSLDVFEDVRTVAGSDTARASFISSIKEQSSIYDKIIVVAHHQNQSIITFHTSERGRARTFLDSMATGQVQLVDNDAQDLLEREQALYGERQAVQDAIAQARAADLPDDDLIADLEADLEQLEADYATVQEEIAGRSDQLAALVPGRSAVPELEEIQAALDDDTTLLSYWVTEEQTFAFVVTADALDVVELEVSRDELLARVRALRTFSDMSEAHPATAVELHEMLIAPVAEHLTTDHLAIIPHDVLHYLPFAALSHGERFLVDEYTLTLLPSASSLLHIQQNTGNELTAPLVLGNPATDNADLPALGGAEQEAKTIASLYDSTPLLGEAATEAEVRDGATAAGILHIAAHGAFNQAAPLESTVYLAPDGENDGQLTVREIYGLDLQQADLVVLSACETQIDDTGIVHGQLSVDSGDELVGLTRAFFYAGTPSVVSTLWRVDDASSALLMERFYTHLRNGMGKAEALRQAQMEVREDYPNPYYWAGYVLSGEAGDVEASEAMLPWQTISIGIALVLIMVAGAWLVWRRRRITNTG